MTQFFQIQIDYPLSVLDNLPKVLFDGETESFTIPEIYRNAKCYLVTLYSGTSSVFDDISTIIIKNNTNMAGTYKVQYGTGKAYNNYIKMENFSIFHAKISGGSIPADTIVIKNVIAFY